MCKLNENHKFEKDILKTIIDKMNLSIKKKNNLVEEELRKKVEAEREYNEEKALILSKVDGLLGKLEKMTEEQQV